MESALILSVLSSLFGMILSIISIKKSKKDLSIYSILKKIKIYIFVSISIFILLIAFMYVAMNNIHLWETKEALEKTRTEIVVSGTEPSRSENSLEMKKEISPLTKDDLVLGDIPLYSSITDIESILKEKPSKESGIYGTLYTFNNSIQITISRISGKTSGVYLLNSGYATNRGITIGDKVSLIKQYYGEPDSILESNSFPDEYDCYGYEYFFKGEFNAILRFVIDSKTNTIRYIGVRVFNQSL